MGFGRSVLGVVPLYMAVASGGVPAGASLSAVNAGVSFRFLATDTRIPASVWVNWAAVTTPGTVRLRLETDNGSGKPSGTLYDANATVDITPSAGWQQCTFAAAPTTPLSPGTLYHLVLITTVAGANHNLRQSWAPTGGGYPLNALYAADASTRTNFTETASSVPVCSFVMTDTSEETFGCAAFAGSSNFSIYGTRAAGVKITVPTGVTLSITGVVLESPLRNGTPDDLRIRILDASGAAVAGASVSIPKAALTGASNKRIIGRFGAAVSLAAGTYRVVVDQVGNTATSGNSWNLYAVSHRSAAIAPSYLSLTTTTDITAGTPTWTDTTTDIPLIGLQLNDVAGTGGGGTYTAAANVRSGTDRGDGTLGTLVVPAAGNVLTGTTFDNGTSGTLTLPTAAQVLLGVTFGVSGTSRTGTVTLPAAADVRSGTTFGASLASTGTIILPSAADVASGVGYGAAGTEFTGSLTGGGGGMTLSQLQGELNTRGLTGTLTTYLNAGVKVSVGTGAGQINVSGGKVPATVAVADVSGNLPANVTQVGGQSASVVDAIDANVTQIAGQAVSAAGAITIPTSIAAVGSAMTLTSGERTAIANEVESQIIDDTDSEKVLKAITDKIAAVNPDLSGLTLSAIAAAVKTSVEAAGGSLALVKAKTDNLPADPASNTQVNTRLAASGYTMPPTTGQIAAAILVTPAQKIVTNASGYVTATNGGGGEGGGMTDEQDGLLRRLVTGLVPDSGEQELSEDGTTLTQVQHFGGTKYTKAATSEGFDGVYADE